MALTEARGAQWTKLIFNSATSPVAALTGLSMGDAAGSAQQTASNASRIGPTAHASKP